MNSKAAAAIQGEPMLDREAITGVTVRTESPDGSSLFVNLLANGRLERVDGTHQYSATDEPEVFEVVRRAITPELLARLEKSELDPLPHETSASVSLSVRLSDGRVLSFWSGPEDVPREVDDFCTAIARATEQLCRREKLRNPPGRQRNGDKWWQFWTAWHV